MIRLREGVKRVVNVLAPILKHNLETGEHLPMIGVRCMSNPYKTRVFRRVSILGSCQIYELPKALPGTNGRGICPLLTDAELHCEE